MLSRVADSLYWMSRYLERAEHTARLTDTHLNLMLDQSPESAERRWSRVLSSLGNPVPDKAGKDAYALAQLLTFDMDNESSVVSCIMSARENARQVREQTSSEMWEQLNRLFLEVKRADIDNLWDAEPLDFLRAVKEGVYLFQGITDSAMSHGEGWQFIQFGRYIERACNTAALLDVHFQQLQSAGSEENEDNDDGSDHTEWIGLLRSCTAFEAYCKVYTADLRPERICEFLLLNPEFPHSVRFAVDQLRTALEGIQEATQSRRADRVSRLAGRLRASLGYGQIDEIMTGGLHAYLENIQRQCAQINQSAYLLYVTYPIEAALEA